MITPVVNRTLHTYHNTLRILCEAFQIEFQGHDHHCERLLVQEAFKIHRAGKMLVPIIDDAHLMPSECLRKLRLLFEDFPHSHNLVLIGQPPLLQSLDLDHQRGNPLPRHLLGPLAAPEPRGHRSVHPRPTRPRRPGPQHLHPGSHGPHRPLRRRPACAAPATSALSSLIEAVRDQTRIVDLKQVNHVLIQPHWRKDCDQPLPL